MDALTQLIESYTSKGTTAITDFQAIRGILSAARALPRAYEHGDNLDAREEMAFAALVSGIVLNTTGLGAVHGFAAPIGARFPAPHGAICAILLPLVIAANITELRNISSDHWGLQRYAIIGQRLTLNITLPPTEKQWACVEVTEKFVRDFKISGLSTYGMTRSSTSPKSSPLAQKSNSMRYNPVRTLLPKRSRKY